MRSNRGTSRGLRLTTFPLVQQGGRYGPRHARHPASEATHGLFQAAVRYRPAPIGPTCFGPMVSKLSLVLRRDAGTYRSDNGQVFGLIRCPDLWADEAPVSNDAAAAYQRGFWIAPRCRLDTSATGCGGATSILSRMHGAAQAEVVLRGGQVFFRNCTRCGPSEALWCRKTPTTTSRPVYYARAGTEPLPGSSPPGPAYRLRHLQRRSRTAHLSADHRGSLITATLSADLYRRQPVLDAHGSRGVFAHHRRPLVERRAVRVGGAVGEASRQSPQILELSASPAVPQIGRVVLITNGLRLGRDPRSCAQGQLGLCRSAARQLHHGIASADPRCDLTEKSRCAARCCASSDIPTQMIFVAVRGVNDHRIGDTVPCSSGRPLPVAELSADGVPTSRRRSLRAQPRRSTRPSRA